MDTAIVAGGDGTPILQSTKYIFDFVVSLIQIYILGKGKNWEAWGEIIDYLPT
ncbi:MAG: hypothetical protein LBI47_02980 [Puniceicoccales bacterium]|nr:hypothetical protein [Puniceicoccales bacterium]